MERNFGNETALQIRWTYIEMMQYIMHFTKGCKVPLAFINYDVNVVVVCTFKRWTGHLEHTAQTFPATGVFQSHEGYEKTSRVVIENLRPLPDVHFDS